MNEKREQVMKQLRAVAHLAKALAETCEGYAEYLESGHADQLLDQAGVRSASQMEILGDMLNGMDAVDESDEALTPVFEEAHRLWPNAVKDMGWFNT